MDETNFYLVIDLEATCCDKNSIPRRETEIIEIGAVMVDAATLDPVDEFATFVQPVRHPRLTPFCSELTTIKQSHVIEAPLFADAMRSLATWIQEYPGFLFCSWGDYDRIQFRRECDFNKIGYPLGSEHLNVKQQFSETLGTTKRYGMHQALNRAGIKLEGTHHRGIDDARNIARLLPFALAKLTFPN